MVHKESLAFAEEWLDRLAYGSVLNRNKPVAPRTIERYRDCVIGRPVETRRKQHPAIPLLDYWAELAPGEPIWTMDETQWLEWVHREIRSGSGDSTKEPSASEVNNKRSASKNFITWLDRKKRVDVDEGIVDYQPPYEDRIETRRKQVKLNPLRDGAFTAIWQEVTDPDDWLWLGMGAFMAMRIDEMANILGSQVDLERQIATFRKKGGKTHVSHYGEQLEEWSYLPHLGDRPTEWVKRFEDHVAKRQEDEERMPQSATDPPWWVWPHTEGEWRPHRENKRKRIWSSTPNDRNRFDKRWQRLLLRAGFERRQFTPHQLRHFASTNMWRAGTPWQRIVTEIGHDEGATTFAYSDFNPEFNRERARNQRKRGLDE